MAAAVQERKAQKEQGVSCLQAALGISIHPASIPSHHQTYVINYSIHTANQQLFVTVDLNRHFYSPRALIRRAHGQHSSSGSPTAHSPLQL
jgi:hypothetical protein